MNQCLRLSYFPQDWKLAVVLAFPKPGKDKLFPQNYRHISLLNTLSKVFEISLYNRLRNFEKQHKTLIEEQFGFRDHRSTVQQLARIANYISTNFNTKMSTAMLLLDIEKAFDTVWHGGLIYKLHEIGIPLYLIKILQSYLKNRTFKVQINEAHSKLQSVVAGVPQGSILGPALFIYYINDIPRHNDTILTLFADDTGILSASKKQKISIRQSSKCIK